jgi:hypothetical protein
MCTHPPVSSGNVLHDRLAAFDRLRLRWSLRGTKKCLML